jgi:predicted DNA-binding transcriptional regulator AlpA
MERKITKKDTYLVMFKEYSDVVDVEQMSEMIGISTKTAYKLLRENKIQHFKLEELIKSQSSISYFI